MAKLTMQEAELLIAAVEVAKDLRESESNQHQHLGHILAGVCATAARLAGDLSIIEPLLK